VLLRMSAGEATGGVNPARCLSSPAARALARHVVDDVEHAEPPPGDGLVVHEVHSRNTIECETSDVRSDRAMSSPARRHERSGCATIDEADHLGAAHARSSS